MSAEAAVREAVIAALRGDAALMDGLNGLFDGQPVRASAPYAVVGECIATDWGAKGLEGRELRLAVILYDAGETPTRLAGLLAQIDAAIAGADAAAQGWRIVTARLVRSRLAKGAGRDGWQAVVDYRLRAVVEAG